MRTVSTSFLARPRALNGNRILGLMNGGGLRFPTGCQQPPDARRPGELPRPHAGLGLRRSPAGAILSSRQDSLFLRSAVSPFRAVWSHPPPNPRRNAPLPNQRPPSPL